MLVIVVRCGEIDDPPRFVDPKHSRGEIRELRGRLARGPDRASLAIENGGSIPGLEFEAFGLTEQSEATGKVVDRRQGEPPPPVLAPTLTRGVLEGAEGTRAPQDGLFLDLLVRLPGLKVPVPAGDRLGQRRAHAAMELGR
ncbi:hypothetical protein [Nannocystis sp.]|uniref:hypothetical protein n=1 Tax=Nannocystis sp. TaxID=1962667 RepID=UPI0025E1B047|nr:hypothetical protein [Nannocystis sp.]